MQCQINPHADMHVHIQPFAFLPSSLPFGPSLNVIIPSAPAVTPAVTPAATPALTPAVTPGVTPALAPAGTSAVTSTFTPAAPYPFSSPTKTMSSPISTAAVCDIVYAAIAENKANAGEIADLQQLNCRHAHHRFLT
ncbi:hypothetical protein V490_04045 [Pseudogymnoascus sp. VKM F-3557]|nr:hypothetical protein V490_04045 [Pseudogymnoascus sp. VKM F-3557]